ncbi:hypothetical protein PtrSN002B_000730 [Pyrenophora tritici-repentis]|uniref:Trichoplein multi-domain protein n=1 Tax=Pyrenophora tritici-repentis TaxID=45151 RepID=A0A2W1FBW4_9PLEO|nr:hypothetical protein PtrV1_04171 [Pyrenophora tritici-repentis]KAF7451855.1 hypothetical protein A1F99_036320 [Pyrenophora tritici-repentis]KAF7575021.1 Trichoplein multi-domain protein [Pyrenophora tritici-repentis]KAI0573967.1 hypothetical protein Alg130_09875 [Pyrenophora tritici-repentis]KAI0589999.1 hypothetical protein Alg215_00122 [Pyrenophora tritici-repentis]
MCRIEERIYMGRDGVRTSYDVHYPCSKERSDRTCPDATRTTKWSSHRRESFSRDNTPSPINPPTPTSSGTYLVQQRRPSGSGSRPSTRDGQRTIKPEIVIEFGAKKDKGKKYPSVSVSSNTYNRTSLGSLGSNDAAIDSPGSESSYIYRTGFPEATLPPPSAFSQPNSYIATPTASHGYHHRPTPSASSSQTPSLYVTSDPELDYDPPTPRQRTRYPPTIIHNPPTAAAPPSPSRRRAGDSSGLRQTTRVTPRVFSDDPYGPEGLRPFDDDLADRSGSSHASSGASDPTRRPKVSDERRKKKSEDQRRQEELDRQLAENIAQEDNIKQVRFELGRPAARTQERAERLQAEKEKERATAREEARAAKEMERLQAEKERERAAAREEARRRKHEEHERERLAQEKKERDDKMARDRKKEKSKPPTSDVFNKRPSGTRRMSSSSMTPEMMAEKRRLLEAENIQMQAEKQAAEEREREERLAAVKLQQETPAYYDPRSGMGRRGSVTRHDSVTRPSGMTRSNSKRRTSISQQTSPNLSTQVPETPYSTRAPSSRTKAPPPLSFPSNFQQPTTRPPSSSRRPSFSQDNPFAAQPPRTPAENPFAHTSAMSPSLAQDPWDLRTVENSLPIAPPPRPTNEARYQTIQPREPTRPSARQGPVYADAFDTGSDSPEDLAPAYTTRTGLSRRSSTSKGTKKKH